MHVCLVTAIVKLCMALCLYCIYIANYLVVMFLICVPLKLSHHLFAAVVIGLMYMSMLKFIHCS